MFTGLKIVLMQTKPDSPVFESNKIKANGHCFTVVSAIAEWHIKFRYVKCISFGEKG